LKIPHHGEIKNKIYGINIPKLKKISLCILPYVNQASFKALIEGMKQERPALG